MHKSTSWQDPAQADGARAVPTLCDDYTAWLVTSLAMRLSRGASTYYTREWGLGSAEYRLVMAAGRFGQGNATLLAAEADVDKAAASRALQRLESTGVVELARSGREVLVTLTQEGRTLHRELRAASRRRDKRLTRGMSEEQIARLRADLLHLIGNLDHMAAAPVACAADALSSKPTHARAHQETT